MRKGVSTFLLTSFLAIGVAASPAVYAETVPQGSSQMQNMPGMTPEEHQQMQSMPGMTPEEHQQMQNMPGMSSNEHQHSHSHGGIETPPNRFVLGMFALLNAAFILIGIWNKFGRRKVA
jgi:hypothetical protein